MQTCCLNRAHQSSCFFAIPFVLLSVASQAHGVDQRLTVHLYTVSTIESVIDYNESYLLLIPVPSLDRCDIHIYIYIACVMSQITQYLNNIQKYPVYLHKCSFCTEYVLSYIICRMFSWYKDLLCVNRSRQIRFFMS